MSLVATRIPMAKKQTVKRTDVLTRISPKALEQARLACAFEGVTMTEFVSQAVLDAAERAIDAGIARRKQAKPPKS